MAGGLVISVTVSGMGTVSLAGIGRFVAPDGTTRLDEMEDAGTGTLRVPVDAGEAGGVVERTTLGLGSNELEGRD